MRPTLLGAAVLAVACPPLAAQQFVLQSGAIPGSPQWTEGCEASDVDNDGDLDLWFADGTGFASAGQKRQNVLVENQLEISAFQFADVSVARLGSHVSHAKMVVTADVQGDGYVDALFCNAWSTDPPFLYVNNPGNPGFFLFEGVTRGFTSSYSSGGAQFGDVDDDGDLDVIVGDAYLNSGFGKPHLFRNDGVGFFTEDAAFTAAAPNKQALMDVQLVDVDGDWDLDFVGACRAENGSAQFGDHFLMRNDGTGAFTNASDVFPDGGSGGVYELELGDLDGDDDLDAFLTSLSGFQDGPIENTSTGGVLSFALGTPLGGDDDNEIALFDYDNDGDYDAFIGSLGSREKVVRNDGGLSFTQLTTVVQNLNDSTLDITAADLDNDGAYDVITAQGESNSAQWANKVYENTGAADTLAPRIVRVEEIEMESQLGPFTFHLEAVDQVMDDGRDWLSCEASYVGRRSEKVIELQITFLEIGVPQTILEAGTVLRWTNTDSVAHSIVSTAPDFPFDSGSLAPFESTELILVSGGIYEVTDGVGGLASETLVVVGGLDTPGDVLDQPGGLFRVSFDGTPQSTYLELLYEVRVTDWAGNLTRRTGRIASGAFERLGCGLNPAESLLTDTGFPSIGSPVQLTVDNPLGAQSAASVAFLVFASQPDPGTICGTYLPGFGMDGGAGEVLVSLAPPFPLELFVGGAIGSSGSNVQFVIPNDAGLVDRTFYCQGLVFDPTGVVRFGLTEGFAVTIFE